MQENYPIHVFLVNGSLVLRTWKRNRILCQAVDLLLRKTTMAYSRGHWVPLSPERYGEQLIVGPVNLVSVLLGVEMMIQRISFGYQT